MRVVAENLCRTFVPTKFLVSMIQEEFFSTHRGLELLNDKLEAEFPDENDELFRDLEPIVPLAIESLRDAECRESALSFLRRVSPPRLEAIKRIFDIVVDEGAYADGGAPTSCFVALIHLIVRTRRYHRPIVPSLFEETLCFLADAFHQSTSSRRSVIGGLCLYHSYRDHWDIELDSEVEAERPHLEMADREFIRETFAKASGRMNPFYNIRRAENVDDEIWLDVPKEFVESNRSRVMEFFWGMGPSASVPWPYDEPLIAIDETVLRNLRETLDLFGAAYSGEDSLSKLDHLAMLFDSETRLTKIAARQSFHTIAESIGSWDIRLSELFLLSKSAHDVCEFLATTDDFEEEMRAYIKREFGSEVMFEDVHGNVIATLLKSKRIKYDYQTYWKTKPFFPNDLSKREREHNSKSERPSSEAQ